MTKWKSPSDVERVFSPALWGYASSHQDEAYMADTPTLSDFNRLYGRGCAESWVYAQVIALFGASSSRDKGIVDGLRVFAHAFAGQVKHYKLSELLLFFAKYKAGCYDSSLSSFDARRIGNAFFREFLPERNYALARIEREKLQRVIEARRFVPPPGYTSLSLYNEFKSKQNATNNLLENKESGNTEKNP